MLSGCDHTPQSEIENPSDDNDDKKDEDQEDIEMKITAKIDAELFTQDVNGNYFIETNKENIGGDLELIVSGKQSTTDNPKTFYCGYSYDNYEVPTSSVDHPLWTWFKYTCTISPRSGFCVRDDFKNVIAYDGNNSNAEYASSLGGNSLTFDIKGSGYFFFRGFLTRNTYTLTFNSNGGSAVAATTIRYQQTFGSLGISNPTRTGYTFSNWSMSSNRTPIISSSTFTANTTLNAHWTPNIYKVTLDRQGGSVGTTEYWYKYNTIGAASDGSTVYYYTNSTCTVPLYNAGSYFKIAIPVRNGYVFGGYYTGTSGSGTNYVNAEGTCVNDLYKNSAADITLYAQWTPITYTLHFDGNGATDGSMSDMSFTYDEYEETTKNAFTKTGYTFIGWKMSNFVSPMALYYAGDGIGWKEVTTDMILDNGETFKNLTCINGDTVTLTAQWTPNIYKVTLDKQGGSGGTDAYWYRYNTTGSANGSTVYYYSDASCSTPLYNSGSYFKIIIPTKTGYTFGGYYTGTSGSGTNYVNAEATCVNDLYKNSAADITLYAQWTANKYNVTFVAGEGVSDSSKFVTYGETYGELPSPSATGKEFLGWYTGSKVGNLFDPYNFVDYMKKQKPDNNLTSFDGKYLQIAGGWTYQNSTDSYIYYKPSYLKVGLTYAFSYKAQSQDSGTTSEKTDYGLGIVYSDTESATKILKDTNINDFSCVFTLQEGFRGFYVGYNYGRVINVWDISLTVVTSTSANLFDPYSYVNYMKEQKPDNNLTSYDGKNLQIAGGWTHQNGDYIYWKPNYLKTGYTYTLKYKAQSQDSGTTAEQPDSALRIGYSKTDSYGLSLSDTNVHEYSVTFTLQEDFRGFYAGYNYGRRIKVWDICVTFGTTANTDLFDTYDFVDYVKQQKEDNNNTSFDGIYLNLHGAWTYTDDYIYYKPSYLVTGKTYTLSYNAQCDTATDSRPVSGLGINYGTQYGYSVSMNSAKVYDYSVTFTLQEGFKGFYVGWNYSEVFKVWNICLVEGSSEGKSDDYSDLVESFTTVTTAKDHSLYGAWASKSYTVTFDANGGSVNPASKVVYYEESYGSLPTPTRANYEFMGWSGAVSVPDFSQWTLANGATYDSSTGILTMGTETAAAYSPIFYVGEMSSLYFYIYAMCNTDSDLNTGVDYYSDANTAYSANGWSGKFTSQGVEVGKWGWTRTLYGKSTEISSGTCRYVRLGIFRDSRFAPQTFYVKKCMLGTTDNYPKTYTTSATKVTTPANHTLVADWKPIARNVTIRIRSSKSGEPDAFEESAAGLKVANYNFYDCPTNGNDTTKCLRALTAAYTNFNHAQGRNLSFLEVTAENGYVFLGYTTTDTAPTVTAAPETAKSWTISSDTTIYLWFKKVSSNQLKYDEEEKYWYFEDGMTLQSYVGDTLNTTLNNNIDKTTGSTNSVVYYKNQGEQKVGLYNYNNETYGWLKASKTMVKKRLKLNANTYFYNGIGSYSSDGLAATLNASAFSGNRYSDCYIQMYCGNDASGNGIYKNFEFLVSEDSNSKCFEFTKTADMRTVILKFNGNLQDAFIGFYDETSSNLEHRKLLENDVTYRLTFNYEFAEDKTTAKVWNVTLSEVFKKDQTYWFKYEPIRWRVSSYGVEKDDLSFCNAYWKDYGSFNKSFMYVSDKIVTISQMTSGQYDLSEGKSYIDTKPNELGDGGYSMNKMILTNTFDYLQTLDATYTKFGSRSSGSDSITETASFKVRVASVEELQTNFSDLRAKPTDYVAFLLGVNSDQYCNYFTRDVGKKYYNMTGIGVDGRVHDYYSNQFMGMRLAMNFSEGSRY